MDIKKQWREKDGKLIHDGDCFFWDRRVCTCGLIHALAPASAEVQETYRGDYGLDAAQQRHVMDHLLRNPVEPLPVMTEEQSKANLEFLEKMFGFKKDDE